MFGTGKGAGQIVGVMAFFVVGYFLYNYLKGRNIL